MEITGERALSLTREQVWDGLMDTRVLRAAIPGCESVTEEGDGIYHAVVLASIGPVRARFKGRIKQRALQKPARYELDFEGDSGMAGFATGSAVVELAETANGGTTLTYRATSQIGGRLAQIGARLIDATVARMSKQFFDRFEEVVTNPALLTEAAAARATAAEARPVAALAAAGAPRGIERTAGAFVLQMPGWAFVTSLAIIAALIAWIAAQ